MITPEQSAQLKDYFPVKAHEFLNGNTYITEEAITNRLDEVDPSWQFKKLEIHRDGSTVTAVYCLMVCGVERDGVGMATVQLSKDKDREVNEAEKSAATDALKRCARLFGIGRYILEMGKSVSDYQSLERWLIQRQGGNVSQMDGQAQQALRGNGQSERRIPPQNPQNAPKANVGASDGNSTKAWEFDLNVLVFEVGRTSKASSQERFNTVKKMHDEENAFSDVESLQDAITLVLGRLAMHDLKEA